MRSLFGAKPAGLFNSVTTSQKNDCLNHQKSSKNENEKSNEWKANLPKFMFLLIMEFVDLKDLSCKMGQISKILRQLLIDPTQNSSLI